MDFFSFEDIERAGSCVRYCEQEMGVEVRNGRCKAAWRGGENPSVAVEKDKWYDHVEKRGGGLLQLCAMHRFNGNIQLAQEWLGRWLNLEPKNHTVAPKWKAYDDLIAQGYKETKRYDYIGKDGQVAHSVLRFELFDDNGNRTDKRFLQRTPFSHTVRDEDRILYNLPVVTLSPAVVVVEGEKDADTLMSMGFAATTNCGGAKNWRDEYTNELAGKDIVICRDNDEAGRLHALTVLQRLFGKVKSIKVVCPSRIEKGDVTDWMEREGGTREEFIRMVKNTPAATLEDQLRSEDETLALVAKEANQTPFSNVSVSNKIVNGKTKTLTKSVAINALLDNLYVRFMGFPRRLGLNQLFDHDKDTGEIEYIDDAEDLFAWIGRKSKHDVIWESMPSSVSKTIFFKGVIQTAKRYDSISSVPDYPTRERCYYTFRNAVVATPNHAAFENFCKFFCTADPSSAIILRSFVAAPIYYRYGIQRPCWVIDSKSGAGVGKTTLVELVGYLYNSKPIQTNAFELKNKFDELLKRIVSPSARAIRLLLIDNVCGSFGDQRFAQMTTTDNFSGRPAYGRGEESRPNNLTFVLTANNAQFDNDVASRAFMFYLRRPDFNNVESWKSDVMRYIDENRYHILGDIIDILRKGASFTAHTSTRVPEFEREVMMPMCGTLDRYTMAINAVLNARNDANIEEERANQARELIADKIDDVSTEVKSQDGVFFIRNEALRLWLKDLHVYPQDVRNYATNGFIDCIDPDIKRYPSISKRDSDIYRAGGVMWYGKDAVKNVVIANGRRCMPVYIIASRDGTHANVLLKPWYDELIAKRYTSEAETANAAAPQALAEPEPEELPF